MPKKIIENKAVKKNAATTKIRNDKYSKMVKDKRPKSPILLNCLKAFLVGGAICTIGQGVNNVIENAFDLSEDMVSSAVVIIMIMTGALLTGFGIYDDLGKWAGAGSIVPITGFANSIVSPAMEFKREGYVFGVGAKMFVLAGPVLVYGIGTSVFVGIIYYFFGT